MVEQTNLYAEQRAEQAKENRTRLRSQARGSAHTSWDAVTDAEMLAFLGCLCYMGDVKIANVRDYWEATYYQPFVADRFPRDRFMALLRSFHLNDNRTTPHTSTSRSLYKIQPLVDVVRKQSQRAYYPGRHLAADEAIAACKSRRSGMVVYTDKHNQWGYKLWMLTECGTSYVWEFDVYKGKAAKNEVGQATSVVLQLARSLQPHRWHIIAMDNWFTSVDLLLQLHDMGFYGIGTAQARRRRFPRRMLIEAEGIERGEYVARQLIDNPSLTCVAWMDKSLVLFMDYLLRPPILSHLWCADPGLRPGSLSLICPALRWSASTTSGCGPWMYSHSASRIITSAAGPRSGGPASRGTSSTSPSNNAYSLYVTRAGAPPEAQAVFRRKLMYAMVDGFTARKRMGRPPRRPVDSAIAAHDRARAGER